MDLLKKLEDCAQRYETVKEQILDPALVKDQKKYKEVMRENNYLSELCALYDEYKKILNGIEEDKKIITEEDDADMKEMAREELKAYEEEQPKMEERIKMKLIPPDPLDEKNIILPVYLVERGSVMTFR